MNRPSAHVVTTAPSRRALGVRGEEAAARFYEEAGYRILGRNWRCTEGELDLVAEDPDGVVVFCEVKTRSSAAFGTPYEAVTAAKQRRLRRLAARWLADRKRVGDRAVAGGMRPVRFDVVAVVPDHVGNLVVDAVPDAF